MYLVEIREYNQNPSSLLSYAPFKLFCPNPPTGSLGVRGKMCVIRKVGALENEVKKGQST